MDFGGGRGIAAAIALAISLALGIKALDWNTAWAQETEATAPAASTADPGAGAFDSASTDEGAAAEESGGESFLRWMFRASGWIGVVLAAMSFYLIALVAWMALNFRIKKAVPRALAREVRELVEQKRFGDAYQRLAADRSLFARVLAAGVRKLSSGLPAGRRAMAVANEDATMEMEHRTTYLATVGTLGPMIGLVGTVYGMILAFRVIADEGSTPQADRLAEGISTALFATLEGIAISIPAIYFYAFFRNRIARMSLEVEMAADPLLEQFAPGVKPEPPASPSPSPPQPPATPRPHPFALSAALAASGGAPGPPRQALPPSEPEQEFPS